MIFVVLALIIGVWSRDCCSADCSCKHTDPNRTIYYGGLMTNLTYQKFAMGIGNFGECDGQAYEEIPFQLSGPVDTLHITGDILFKGNNGDNIKNITWFWNSCMTEYIFDVQACWLGGAWTLYVGTSGK